MAAVSLCKCLADTHAMYNDLAQTGAGKPVASMNQIGDDRIAGDLEAIDLFAAEIEKAEKTVLPRHLNADPERVEQGLAKLVLAVVDLLRRLMEKQAIRRIEGGSLTDEEIERLGLAFMRMEEKLEELKLAFGLENEDLNLNLGPLGDLW
jgi:Gas vesicle protein K